MSEFERQEVIYVIAIRTEIEPTGELHNQTMDAAKLAIEEGLDEKLPNGTAAMAASVTLASALSTEDRIHLRAFGFDETALEQILPYQGDNVNDHSESGSMSAEEKDAVERERIAEQNKAAEQEGEGAVDLLGTTDPAVWAHEFSRIWEGKPVSGPGCDGSHEVSESDLIGWFANAFTAAEIQARKDGERSDQEDAPEERPFRFSASELHELVFLAAGAATAPLMRDSGLVMPSEEIIANVNQILEERGYPPSVPNAGPHAEDWLAISDARTDPDGGSGQPA
jgi:hypothetical protein